MCLIHFNLNIYTFKKDEDLNCLRLNPIKNIEKDKFDEIEN